MELKSEESHPVEARQLPIEILIKAQRVMANTNSIGIKVNAIRLPERFSQSVIDKSVSAAKSWFDAPKRVQN